jgi:hypothetical protein
MTALIDHFSSTYDLFHDYDLLPKQWPVEVSMLFDDMSPLPDELVQIDAGAQPRCASACVQTEGIKKRHKSCFNCNTPGSRTPQFREGPDGPQTLCNACGVAYKKHGHEGLKCRAHKIYQRSKR